MELLVVPPLGFRVEESYNTRMRPDYSYGKVDSLRAGLQWQRMIHHLHYDMGVKIRFAEPRPELADAAFACDPGFWLNGEWIAANFQVPQRRKETEYLKEWMYDHGYYPVVLPPDSYFEGGDAVMVDKTIILGYGNQRTNWEGVVEIMEIVSRHGVKVVPIRRVTEEFYHLNSVLTYYPSANLIAYFTEAFEASAHEKLREVFPDKEILPLNAYLFRYHSAFDNEYLYSYCLNSIEHNKKVLMPWCHDEYRKFLESRDLKVIVPEDGSSEWERSGGSFRCMTMIHNEISN